MKLITLNTWGGRAGSKGLLDFFANHKNDTDIFCLQEIWSAPYKHLDGRAAGGVPLNHDTIMVRGMQEISGLLSGHTAYFRPHYMDSYGLMMLVKNSIDICAEGEVFVHKNKGYLPGGDIGNHARNIQYVTIDEDATKNSAKSGTQGRNITIINFHGLWNGKGKTDTEERIAQSKKIIEFIKTVKGEVILCGDFNLLPDTESLRMFEKHGLRDLIKEYGITSTRTSFYQKPYKFADYIFVSAGISVLDFRVLPDEVSDHAPLVLEFE